MPSQKKFYRPELDVLRFAAFLLVFFDHGSGSFHSALAAKIGEASRVGLQLFFILSSYLISELLLREREKTGTIHIQSFFLRRVLRIWPLYFFFIGAVYVAGRFHHGYFPTGALLAFVALAGNWYIYAYGFLAFAVGILWSISVEEQFYLLWPFLVRAGGARALKLVIPFVFAVSALAIWYAGHHALGVNKYWTNSLIEFQYFAVGAVLALLLHRREFQPSAVGRTLLFGGFVAAFLLLVFRFPVAAPDRVIATPGLFAAFLLLGIAGVCLFLGFYGVKSFPAERVLVYLGRISYGLYVFHLFALQACEALLRRSHLHRATYAIVQLSMALAVTVAMAALSYRILETPFLKLKSRFTFVHSRDG